MINIHIFAVFYLNVSHVKWNVSYFPYSFSASTFTEKKNLLNSMDALDGMHFEESFKSELTVTVDRIIFIHIVPMCSVRIFAGFSKLNAREGGGRGN